MNVSNTIIFKFNDVVHYLEIRDENMSLYSFNGKVENTKSDDLK